MLSKITNTFTHHLVMTLYFKILVYNLRRSWFTTVNERLTAVKSGSVGRYLIGQLGSTMPFNNDQWYYWRWALASKTSIVKPFREIPVHTGMIQALPLVFSGGSIRVQERDFLLNLKLGLIACQFNVSLSWLRNPQNKIMITKI